MARADKLAERSLDGLTVDEQLLAIHKRVRPTIDEMYRVWFEELHPELKLNGVTVCRYDDLSDEEAAVADDFFRKHVFAILTPLAVDPGHPFPFISNLSRSMGIMLEAPDGTRAFCRLKLPENLPRWVPLPTGGTRAVALNLVCADIASSSREVTALAELLGLNREQEVV